MDVSVRRFRARVLQPEVAARALEDQATRGEATIMVAAFDVPDTGVAMGNDEAQVIDRGAFDSWIARSDFETQPVPLYADHGEYWVWGTPLWQLKLGRSSNFREGDDAGVTGLLVDASYNLQKQIAREAFSDLLHDPNGANFSFTNMRAGEVTYRAEDGMTHVKEMTTGVEEVSQVGEGAQTDAHLVAARSRLSLATSRSLSLTKLMSDLYSAWDEQSGGYSWIEESFVDEQTLDSGEVIVAKGDGDFVRIPWSAQTGSVVFDTTGSQLVQKEWTPALAERAAQLRLARNPVEIDDSVQQFLRASLPFSGSAV